MTNNKIKEIINNIGYNHEKSISLILDLEEDILNLKDENGYSLLFHAIRMNDGGLVTYLLLKGADIYQKIHENEKMSYYDYAEKYKNYNGREEYAYSAIQSYNNIKNNIKVEIINNRLFNKKNIEKYGIMKSKNPNDLITLYHGLKTFGISKKSIKYTKEIINSNKIKEISGPTLSLNPIGQYWYGLGLSIEVPRKLIKFEDEENIDAIIEVKKDGVAFIKNKEIKLDEFNGKLMLNLESCNKQNIVEQTYYKDEVKVGNYGGKLEINIDDIKSLNEIVDDLNQKKINYLNKNNFKYRIKKLRVENKKEKICQIK